MASQLATLQGNLQSQDEVVAMLQAALEAEASQHALLKERLHEAVRTAGEWVGWGKRGKDGVLRGPCHDVSPVVPPFSLTPFLIHADQEQYQQQHAEQVQQQCVKCG